MDELLQILNEMIPDVDFSKEDNLIDDGILDSLQIMSLVIELNDAFDIEITPLAIMPENFKSAETIFNLITKLQDE